MKILLFVLCGLFTFSALLGKEKTDPKAEEILDYWFGTLNSPDDFPKDKIILWFGKKNHIDNEIRVKYEYLLQAAAKNELNNWKNTPRGFLALIILLDQFPRNMYRDTPQAFAFDHQAVALSLEGIDKHIDENLLPIERAFFYFPLMHAENLAYQKISVEKYKHLTLSAPPQLRSNYKSYEDLALRYYDVIESCGRFAHRNKTLGRTSTQTEQDFLKTPGSSF